MRFKGVPEASGPITRIHSFSTCFLSIHIYQASCYLLDTVVCVCVWGGGVVVVCVMVVVRQLLFKF